MDTLAHYAAIRNNALEVSKATHGGLGKMVSSSK